MNHKITYSNSMYDLYLYLRVKEFVEQLYRFFKYVYQVVRKAVLKNEH
ncbi:hypothetical protein [Staphylococcus americanisciuri]|uniref:Uncharacterized protein n=1 Tax=Staphylococcus americanisciuri TaxID=2973940 RepID=A0ABT2F274_9STAP|nr:hypothetical protein [Staphylococcus americanisciuri]MCS4486371.1 hypothetical protein [Staphylococcus americanisciuri]